MYCGQALIRSQKMVWLSFLLVVLLSLYFLVYGTVDNVDTRTLGRIIQFFEDNYMQKKENGAGRQYAVAINVPQDQCLQTFNPDKNNFLTTVDATNVKNKIYDLKVALYENDQLIAAGILKRKKYNIHSEGILLNTADPSKTSPMDNLLNKRSNGCVIFYTLNSPCVDTCINNAGKYSILGALEKWSKREGLKAFVFKDFWKFDIEKRDELIRKFQLLARHVPLYRCVTRDTCYACVNGDNINAGCLPPRQK